MDDLRTFTDRVEHAVAGLGDPGEGALAALYDLTAARLVRYAITLMRHQHDAEDAVHAVLVRLANRRRPLQDARCPWSYLLRMVRNESLYLIRRQKRCLSSPDLADVLARRRVDELERQERSKAVWRALRQLPAEQAEVIVLKVWEELTFAQIAEVLEESPSTVASRYRYGTSKLAEKLASLQMEVLCD